MARIERMKLRLENWALWRARRDGNGLGWKSFNMLAAWMAEAGVQHRYGGSRESAIPVLELEAEETDRAVESLRLAGSHLYLTLMCMYVKDLGIKGTAQHLHRSESTVHAQLGQADAAIDAWLQERARQREQRRAQAEHEQLQRRRTFTS